jgi:glutathione S-transferase
MTDSKLTLVSHALCPFVQRAVIVLKEKSIPFERIMIDLAAKPGWFLALSPLGKVPLLRVIQDDGHEAVLFESMAICEFLEESQTGTRLYPADPLDRARHRAWIEFMSSMLGDAWGFLTAKDEATASAKGTAFREKLQRLDRELPDAPYFAGTSFGMVDAVAAPIFRYFDVLAPSVGEPLFAGLTRVSAWRSALAVRPSIVAAVASDYAARFHTHLATHGALLSV